MVTGIAVLVFATMAVEARRASRNERAQRARGGVEPADDVYRAIRIVYPLSFAAMVAEGFVRGMPPAGLAWAGAAVFASAKALKWWAIRTLGEAWTFRVIVTPEHERVTRGPYAILEHPNYVAVVGEFVGTMLMAGAVVSGPIATLVFGALLKKRIAVEERALSAAQCRSATSK